MTTAAIIGDSATEGAFSAGAGSSHHNQAANSLHQPWCPTTGPQGTLRNRNTTPGFSKGGRQDSLTSPAAS